MISLESKISALKKMEQAENSTYNKIVLNEVIKDIKDEIKFNGMKGAEHQYKVYMLQNVWIKFCEFIKLKN
jgi:hypothetical protein